MKAGRGINMLGIRIPYDRSEYPGEKQKGSRREHLQERLQKHLQELPWELLADQSVKIVVLPMVEQLWEKQCLALPEQRLKCGQAGIELGLYIKHPISDWQSRSGLWKEWLGFLKSPEWKRGEGEAPCRVLLDVMDPDEIYRLNREILRQGICDDLKALRECGVQPVLYGNKYWQTVFFDFELPEGCYRWIAQYHRDCTYEGRYEAWEYTSAARIKGVDGLVALMQYEPGRCDGRDTGEYYPDLRGYVGTSIAGALNRAGYPSDFQTRKRLAEQTGCWSEEEPYTGTAEQNRRLIKLLGGTVCQSRMLREGAYVRILPEGRDVYSGRRFEPVIYHNTFQVITVSGASLTFGIGDAIIGTTGRNAVAVVL